MGDRWESSPVNNWWQCAVEDCDYACTKVHPHLGPHACPDHYQPDPIGLVEESPWATAARELREAIVKAAPPVQSMSPRTKPAGAKWPDGRDVTDLEWASQFWVQDALADLEELAARWGKRARGED